MLIKKCPCFQSLIVRYLKILHEFEFLSESGNTLCCFSRMSKHAHKDTSFEMRLPHLKGIGKSRVFETKGLFLYLFLNSTFNRLCWGYQSFYWNSCKPALPLCWYVSVSIGCCIKRSPWNHLC